VVVVGMVTTAQPQQEEHTPATDPQNQRQTTFRYKDIYLLTYL